MMTLDQEQDRLEPFSTTHHLPISSDKSSKSLLQSASLEFLHMPPHGYMKGTSLDDKDSPTALSVSSSISPRSSTSTLFTRAQVRLSSRFPKRVQSTLFPLRENTQHKQGKGFFGHRGSSSVTSLRDTARDDEDSCEEDKLKMFSITESMNGYHVPWRHYQRNKVNWF
jgi:hypothetical protein